MGVDTRKTCLKVAYQVQERNRGVEKYVRKAFCLSVGASLPVAHSEGLSSWEVMLEDYCLRIYVVVEAWSGLRSIVNDCGSERQVQRSVPSERSIGFTSGGLGDGLCKNGSCRLSIEYLEANIVYK